MVYIAWEGTVYLVLMKKKAKWMSLEIASLIDVIDLTNLQGGIKKKLFNKMNV